MISFTYFLLLLFFILFLFILVRLFLYRKALLKVLKKWCHWIEDRIQVHQHYRVPEFNHNLQDNLFYNKVSTYLNSLSSVEDSDFANLFSGNKPTEIILSVDDNQIVRDTFLGARVSWRNQIDKITKNRTFVLNIKKKDKRRILQSYIQHIHTVSDESDQRRKEVRLFINAESRSDRNGRWTCIPFNHPATLDTMVMDSDLKSRVKSDLESFLKSKQYYHRLGRVWKRNYLLYGPSGTGKSSFVAAMAKFLNYDVYDIDLSRVSDDSDLKMLLLQTKRKSMIVVEDLDRHLTTDNSSATVSFSGMLNFMDGIVNSCSGDEKIMVFTMNCKDSIDQAMLRPGRIDVHIYFPLCNFNSFKTLASNYLGLKDHKLFPQVEEIFQTGATLSPAEIGEIMIMNRGSPSRALKSVITALQIDGDARAAAAKNARRLSNSASSRGPPEEAEEGGVPSWKDVGLPAVKEIRKLYGILRLKSGRKLTPSDHDSGMIER